MKSVVTLRSLFFFVAFLGITAFLEGQNETGWVASWATSQQMPEPQNSLPPEDLHDATLRQIVHLSVGGQKLRLHLSNAFGQAPLRLTSVHIARPVSLSAPDIEAGSDRTLTFHGSTEATIAAGAEFISDPVDYVVMPLSSLTISIHYDQPPSPETAHPGSRATSYVVHGDFTSAATLTNPKRVDHWYQVAGIDVRTAVEAESIVVLGDSITDGHGATTNGNDRWTDVLARRLQEAPDMHNRAVLNAGIGGNHLLTDGLGPSALARFDRDVLAPAGVRYLIVLEGVNDLGTLSRKGEATPAEHAALVQQMLAAYEQIVVRARTHGIRAMGVTILPYMGSGFYHPQASNEADRQAINAWIRVPGHFDAVIDLDAVTRDGARPDHLLPKFDSGDHLHPSAAGYAAMGDAVPLALFTSSAATAQPTNTLK